MTDHRVTDITYGHLGEATYDLDVQKWIFSRQTTPESSIQPLHSPKECIPPSFSTPPIPCTGLSKRQYTQDRWLANAFPETGPASTVLSSLRRDEKRNVKAEEPSTILAVGMASDIDHDSGSRKTQIIAMAYGEAGNVLRLIKPRVEALGWDGRRGTKLRSLNAISSENGYWVGDGGPIRTINFAADTNGLTSWLAVQKSECTTILSPTYHQVNAPSISTMEMGKRYPPSRLNANPILTMKLDKTDGRPHADVSFNPWYVRQFAIVDQQGYWSVWDIEGQKKKRVTFEATPGKSGHISDDSSSDLSHKFFNDTDGWARILWAGSLRTLVVCDRHRLAVFDIKGTPKRLYSPVLVSSDSDEWILDAKRDPNSLQHIFVLTSKQVFWLQITAASEDHDELNGHVGARIIISVRHFRNDEDETAKLALLGEKDVCMVLLYSMRTRLVNTYRFGMLVEGTTTPSVSQGSFEIAPVINGRCRAYEMFRTICLLPTSFMLHNLNPMSGPAKDYALRNIRFYQLFAVHEDLRLSHMLCATKKVTSGKSNAQLTLYETVVAPIARGAQSSKAKISAPIIEDSFVVPDGLEETDDEADTLEVSPTYLEEPRSPGRKDILDSLSMTLNARHLFEASYLPSESIQFKESTSPSASLTMVEYVKNLQTSVEKLRYDGPESLTTLSDLTGYTTFSEDIDEAASVLRELSTFLEQEDGSEKAMSIKAYKMLPSPFAEVGDPYSQIETMPDLSNVYDKIVDLWVSCLPQETPGPARLAKERIVRSIAMELYLNSVAFLVRDKSVLVPKPAALQPGVDFILPVRGKPDSLELIDGQGTQGSFVELSSNLPLSVPTPPMTLRDPSTQAESVEDPAISRLRGYALSIKSEPRLGAAGSAILAHWPFSPGADPFKYSWEAARTTATDDEGLESDEEEAMKRQKEEARRKRRTARFLKRQRADTIEAASQPAPATPFGSQPTITQHPLSSQPDDILMTQPDRGVFGSRPRIKGFKKRRVRGF